MAPVWPISGGRRHNEIFDGRLHYALAAGGSFSQIRFQTSIADPLEGNEIDLEGSKLAVVESDIQTLTIRLVFTSHRSDWSSPAMPSIMAFIHFSTNRAGKPGCNRLPRSTKSRL